MLNNLAQALTPDWHEVRLAGRVARHTSILRGLAHELSTDSDRVDRPTSAAQAEARFQAHVDQLRRSAPRSGIGVVTGRFVDHIAALAQRYGSHLFVCFDDERIPSTTNALEGFFGRAKRLIRRATGSGSTTNSVAQNLGADFLMAFARFEKQATAPAEALDRLDVERFRTARAGIASAEAPASHRRSLVRNFDQHLQDLRARWQTPLDTS